MFDNSVVHNHNQRGWLETRNTYQPSNLQKPTKTSIIYAHPPISLSDCFQLRGGGEREKIPIEVTTNNCKLITYCLYLFLSSDQWFFSTHVVNFWTQRMQKFWKFFKSVNSTNSSIKRFAISKNLKKKKKEKKTPASNYHRYSCHSPRPE